MVMRANVVLTITQVRGRLRLVLIVTLVSGQEIDKHWRVVTETSIKAKSVRGYSTYNRKLTENKWKAGTEKPELVEDWDQRLLVTTLNRKEDGNILELTQIAEKDQVLNACFITTYILKELSCYRNFVLTALHPFKWSPKMKTSLE